MTSLDRRQLMIGSLGVLAVTALPTAAMAVPRSLISDLPGLSPRFRDIAEKLPGMIRRFGQSYRFTMWTREHFASLPEPIDYSPYPVWFIDAGEDCARRMGRVFTAINAIALQPTLTRDDEIMLDVLRRLHLEVQMADSAAALGVPAADLQALARCIDTSIAFEA